MPQPFNFLCEEGIFKAKRKSQHTSFDAFDYT